MLQRKYFHNNFVEQEIQSEIKKEFIAFRLETNKFLLLKQEASERNLDLSSLIRLKLEDKNE